MSLAKPSNLRKISIVRLLMKCARGCLVNSTFFSITAHLIPGSGAVARDCNCSSLTILVVHIKSKGKAPHAHCATFYKPPPPSLLLWRQKNTSFGTTFRFARSGGRLESCITLEPPGPPLPCVHLLACSSIRCPNASSHEA